MTKLTGAEVIIKVFKDHSVAYIWLSWRCGLHHDEIFKSNVSPPYIS